MFTFDAKLTDHKPGNKSQSHLICASTLLAIIAVKASKSNTGASAAVRRWGADGRANQKIGAATARIYKLLHEGEYIDSAGRRNCLTLLVPSPVFVGSSRRGGDVRMSRRRENTGTHNDYCVLRFEAMCRRWATSWA